MGQISKPNRVLSEQLLQKLISIIESKIVNKEDEQEHYHSSIFSAYVTITYFLSLRGAEGCLCDITGTLNHWKKQHKDFVLVALLGKVKVESQGRAHLLSSVNVTRSGIEIKKVS